LLALGMLLVCGCIVSEQRYAGSGETVVSPQGTPDEGAGGAASAETASVSGETGAGAEPAAEVPGEAGTDAASEGVPPAGSPERDETGAGALMGEEHLTVEKTEIGEGETEKEYGGMRFDGYTLLLEDLTDDYPYPCAALRVVKISGTEITEYERTEICPGKSRNWESPEGKEYRIKVFETAAGYSEGAAWADIAIYGQ